MSCNPGSVMTRLEAVLKELPANSHRRPVLQKLLEDMREDQRRGWIQSTRPTGGQQPYPLDDYSRKGSKFQKIVKGAGMNKRGFQPKSTIGEYQKKNMECYDDAFKVDSGKKMTAAQVAKKREYIQGRAHELATRYNQRELDSSKYDAEEDIVQKMLDGFKRRDQEMAWRQPDSSFRKELGENQPDITRYITAAFSFPLRRDYNDSQLQEKMAETQKMIQELKELSKRFPNFTHPDHHTFADLIHNLENHLEEFAKDLDVDEEFESEEEEVCDKDILSYKERIFRRMNPTSQRFMEMQQDIKLHKESLSFPPEFDGCICEDPEERAIQEAALEYYADAFTPNNEHWSEDEMVKRGEYMQARLLELDAQMEHWPPHPWNRELDDLVQNIMRAMEYRIEELGYMIDPDYLKNLYAEIENDSATKLNPFWAANQAVFEGPMLKEYYGDSSTTSSSSSSSECEEDGVEFQTYAASSPIPGRHAPPFLADDVEPIPKMPWEDLLYHEAAFGYQRRLREGLDYANKLDVDAFDVKYIPDLKKKIVEYVKYLKSTIPDRPEDASTYGDEPLDVWDVITKLMTILDKMEDRLETDIQSRGWKKAARPWSIYDHMK